MCGLFYLRFIGMDVPFPLKLVLVEFIEIPSATVGLVTPITVRVVDMIVFACGAEIDLEVEVGRINEKPSGISALKINSRFFE